MSEVSIDIGTRIFSIILIMAAAWGGGWTAFRAAGSRSMAGSANALAAGFLLGAGLLHFLPEAHEHFGEVFPDNPFPIGFAICALGFTAILALERLVFDPEGHKVEGGGNVGSASVLTIALSLHALLAGFAVGAEPSAAAGLVLTAALAVHKFAASFTLGSGLVRAGTTGSGLRTVVLAFSLATPIGMVLGGATRGIVSDHAGALFEATFDALAAGTFLYIAALDVIHEEFYHKRASWKDLGLFVGGLAVMAVLSVFA